VTELALQGDQVSGLAMEIDAEAVAERMRVDAPPQSGSLAGVSHLSPRIRR
jgi:hypothetical protein